ncbi:hypothetical protein PUNSTDRAFT_135613 [Punctularia strigosozonata HHB-11173 SS5]|uniref:uncharacterized protein n=1 Tax=Punctularia strigosozonata (strain HHB-11173) TaxID=741275 RepID=UPI000441699F|nr:uncharacterized protein PUNSTDRAFT_135613 [Punctularia strigosozonata HHB-11173 SS5]EIN08099.1 hypothetical protein PUNSTDRAFT_135613 [Punctularia strigosozonata HHB-11173 SS5]
MATPMVPSIVGVRIPSWPRCAVRDDSFNNPTAVVARMQELGIYLIGGPDQEPAELSTGDEPNGWEDPLNATQLAYDTIYGLDWGYHPVSLVLNCQDYYFTVYSAGADIWGTVCTPDYGDCGCDNCKGFSKTYPTGLDSFHPRQQILGPELPQSVWTVPQAFGNDTYWKRYPTGAEYTVFAALTINHAATAVVAWDQPAPDDLFAAASALAAAPEPAKAFILSPEAVYTQSATDRVDVAT